ncbi:cupin domain-containing protein [Candidatus Thorarchaeota archaeon]|nr:MAG: cupin domain-containing protein [Candidatus Thorarchaeota archaeon]
MVRVYKATDVESVGKEGYSAKYVADLLFKKATGSAGVILVHVQAGERTKPHAHGYLEEIFIPLEPALLRIDDKRIELDSGDVVVVEPQERHSFEAKTDAPLRLVAIKVPNLKNDRMQ